MKSLHGLLLGSLCGSVGGASLGVGDSSVSAAPPAARLVRYLLTPSEKFLPLCYQLMMAGRMTCEDLRPRVCDMG